MNISHVSIRESSEETVRESGSEKSLFATGCPLPYEKTLLPKEVTVTAAVSLLCPLNCNENAATVCHFDFVA